LKARDWRLERDGEDEHRADERWLITYADLITLLMVFFVVMYALSARISGSNFEKLQSSLSSSLKKTPKDLFASTPSSNQELTEIQDKVKRAVTEFEGKSQVKVDMTSRGLVISLYDTAFFDVGQSVISPSGYPALAKIATTIATMSNAISVEGHTDNIPPAGGSNWVLAAQRASSIIDYMVKRGVPAKRFQIISYAEFKPLFPNDTPEHRALNRRVDIVIQDHAPKAALTPTPTPADQLLAPVNQPGGGNGGGGFENPFGGGGMTNPFGTNY
jgi:chemotaxis protein MotB